MAKILINTINTYSKLKQKKTIFGKNNSIKIKKVLSVLPIFILKNYLETV